MIFVEMFLKELNQEAVATRKILAAVPNDRLEWQPHPKSISLRALAVHIAELPTWISLALTTDELDFAAAPNSATNVNTSQELTELFEQSLIQARLKLIPESETKMNEPWTIRSGETAFSTNTKAETVRHTFNQITHHRAQLEVYLRLLDIDVPSAYGSTTDNPEF